jgi:hypothetical protein
MVGMGRRTRRSTARAGWAAGLAALGSVALGLTAAVPTTAQPYSEWVHYRRLDLATPWGPQRVLVTFPRRGDHSEHPPGVRYPVLIALHGRAEAVEGPERGYLGWTLRYGLPDAFGALMRGRLGAGDYRGFVREAHLEHVNDRLRNERFRGLMVVTPYVPDLSGQPVGAQPVRRYADWLAGPLLEAVRERFEGAARSREGTGIDGVSLGGRVALEAGLSHPEAFGAVGGLQPAIRGEEQDLARLAVEAARAHPQRVRLLTSEEDRVSLVPTRRLSAELVERRLTHTLTLVPGRHGYAFNRGPAGLEMLLFHDRALAREPLPDGE